MATAKIRNIQELYIVGIDDPENMSFQHLAT